MFGLIRRGRRDAARVDDSGSDHAGDKALAPADEPNPAVALAVGLIYVFRTSAGARLMRELEGAVRKYSADPQALWKLVREGEPRADVIDTTAVTAKELPDKK